MSGSLGKEESSNQSSFNQDVWGPQGEALQNLYGAAGNLYNQLGSSKGGVSPIQQASQGQDFITQTLGNTMPAWQQQLAGGAYRDMGLQNQFLDSMNRSFATPSASQEINEMIMGGQGNDYVDAMKDTMVSDAERIKGMNSARLDQRAGLMGGSSGHGVADFLQNQSVDQDLIRSMSDIGYKSFDKDLDRKLGIAQQADANTLQRQQMLSNMIGSQNQTMQNAVGFAPTSMNLGQTQYGLPWQNMQNYAGIIGGPTVLGSGSSSGNSKGFGASGGASKSK